MGEEFLVHAFVNHAGNLAIAAQGQPAHAVFGLSDAEVEELEPADVEEEVEFIYPDAEKLGKEEMPQLMEEDEDGKRQDHLEDFHQHNHQRAICSMSSFARARASSLEENTSSSVGWAMNGRAAMQSRAMAGIS